MQQLHKTLYLDFSRRVVIITTMNSKQLIKRLEEDGWSLRGVKGSHHIFIHPSKPGHISVPHPKQELGVGLLHKLLKQAGLK
jgi:predicted RNA binding protein YcfA (HicA-like mRNA interferase family)